MNQQLAENSKLTLKNKRESVQEMKELEVSIRIKTPENIETASNKLIIVVNRIQTTASVCMSLISPIKTSLSRKLK